MRVVLCVFFAVSWSVQASAAISKVQLLEMIEKGVDLGLITQLVERDCVDFEVTPEAAIELSPRVPGGVLEAAIKCRASGLSPSQDSSGTALSDAEPFSYKDIQTIAVVPATLDGARDDSLTAAFVGELKRWRRSWVIVDAVELQVHFEGNTAFQADAPISSLLAAARSKGAQAVLLLSGKKYRRFDDPGIRLDLKIVEVNQGKVVWSGGDKGVSNFYNWNAAMKNASKNTVKALP